METLRVVKRKRQVDLHRHRCGDRPRVHDEERRGDRLSLLSERVQAHVHRHEAPGRLDEPLHRRLLLREGHRRERRRRCSRSSPSARRSRSSSRTWSTTRRSAPSALLRRRRRCPSDGSPIKDVEVEEGHLRHAPRRDRRARSSARPKERRRSAAACASASRASSTSTRRRRSSGRTSRRSASRSRTSSSPTRRPRRCGSRAASTARSTRATRPRSRRRTSTTCSSTSTPTKKPLKYIFFPILTHVPNFVDATRWTTRSCPIVAGAPDVMKAAFTKEVDFFATRGIEYLDPALSFVEPNLMAQRMFETFGPAPRHHRGRERPRAAARRWKALDAVRERPPGQGPRHPRDRRGREPRRHPDDRAPVPLGPGPEPRHPRGVPGARLPDPLGPLDPEGRASTSIATSRRSSRAGDQDARSSSTTSGRRTTRPTARRRCGPRSFAAHHPNVVVLDLSSLQVRSRRADLRPHRLASSSESKTPYAALHDIDANKPGGSIKIRVKTYAHALQAPRGAPRGRGKRKRRSSSTRIDKKRLELLELKAKQLDDAPHAGPGARARRSKSSRAKLAAYVPHAGRPTQPEPPEGHRASSGRRPRTGRSSRARQHRRDERR